MEIKDLKPNDHVWALLDDLLVICIFKSVISTHDKGGSLFYVCGAWECPILPSQIKIISVIEKPTGHEKTKTYY